MNAIKSFILQVLRIVIILFVVKNVKLVLMILLIVRSVWKEEVIHLLAIVMKITTLQLMENVYLVAQVNIIILFSKPARNVLLLVLNA